MNYKGCIELQCYLVCLEAGHSVTADIKKTQWDRLINEY